MEKKVCIVYHSGFGHTARRSEAVAEGVQRVAEVNCISVSDADLEDSEGDAWTALDEAGAIIFGCPTYMGSLSADMKKFMETTSDRWQEQKWADKLAAGFTNSGSRNGDKQNTLFSLLTLAAQHGMTWINLNQLPGKQSFGRQRKRPESAGRFARRDGAVECRRGPGHGPSRIRPRNQSPAWAASGRVQTALDSGLTIGRSRCRPHTVGDV